MDVMSALQDHPSQQLHDKLQQQLHEVCLEYEKFLAGQRKLLPYIEHEALRRSFLALKPYQEKNAVLRFKLENIQKTFQSYDSRWQRIIFQLERGGDPRQSPQRQLRSDNALTASINKPLTKSATKQLWISLENNSQAIYQQLMDAHQQLGKTFKTTAQQLQKKLSEDSIRLQKQYGCQDIEYQVIIKDEKATLKAVLKS